MQGIRSKALRTRHLKVVAALTIALGAVVATSYPAAQTRAAAARAVSDDPALNAILLELRGLRADLASSSGRQLTAQLLVARVQMQEQRIAYLDAQRAAAAVKAADAAQALTAMRGPGQLECRNLPSVEARRECEAQVEFLKVQAAGMEANVQRLRAELSGLENGVAVEQQRWSEFNDRLDVLERSLSGR